MFFEVVVGLQPKPKEFRMAQGNFFEVVRTKKVRYFIVDETIRNSTEGWSVNEGVYERGKNSLF